MAEPKKRTNKSKTNMRRMHIKATAINFQYCPNCQEPKESHKVCPGCGFYKGQKVIDKK